MMTETGSAGVGRRESGDYSARKDGRVPLSSPTPPAPADNTGRR